MKKHVLLLLAIFIAIPLAAQQKLDEAEIIQASFGVKKKAIMESFVNVPETEKDAFWKLYDEYETKRAVYGKERIKLLTEYAEKWQDLKPEDADRLVLESVALNNKFDKLLAQYYKKIRKATSIETAVKFYQVETYIRATVHFYVKNTIPFVYGDN